MPKFGADGDPGKNFVDRHTEEALDDYQALRGSTAIGAYSLAPTAKLRAKSIVGRLDAGPSDGSASSAAVDGRHAQATDYDRGHYHILIEADGKVWCAASRRSI